MWYLTEIKVKQNPFFYTQKDNYGNLIVRKTKNIEYENDIDKTEYIFKGNLGCVFKSYEDKKPDIYDRRFIFGVEFKPYSYNISITKLNFLFFFITKKKYEICWVSDKLNSYEDIANFYYENMVMQLPSGIKIDCFKKCLTKKFKMLEDKCKI